MRTTWIISIMAALFFLSAGFSAVFAQDADAQLNNFFKKYLEERFKLRPFDATLLGDHRFDNLLDDLTPEARKTWQEYTRKTLEELPKQVDYQRLSRDGRIDYEILQHQLTASLWLTENLRPFEKDPRVYNDYINDSVYMLLAQSTLPKEENIANCIARMKLIPQVIAAARQNLQNPPAVATETAIKQNRGAIAFYQRDIFQLAGETPQLDALKAAAAELVPHLKQYQEFLENDLLPRANGEWRLGKEKYAKKLELELESGVTPNELLADAEAEFYRVQRDMYVIARQLWSRYFPQQPLPPDDEPGRHSTIAQVLDQIALDHGKPEDLVNEARTDVKRIKRFITEHDILRLPQPDYCRVIEMPEFKRGNSTAYCNSAPPLDPKATSFYAVSPPPKDWDAKRVESLLQEYNRYMLQILTIHEAYPGHFVQLEYAHRCPSLIRRVFESGVFVEGWAVYTEQMMIDQGYGDRDLALRLTQLKFYLRAVANAILDHKMHCTAMTDDEALKFLTEQCFQSEGEARLKIIRAKQTSCQLSTYFVGRMALYRLRQAIERELGERFELGRYHEAVLDHGSVPVKYLHYLVRDRLSKPR
jgi:uncharacterized protein (DUF885 family)